MMLQNHLKYNKVNAKIQKKSFGNDSSDAIKAALRFLDTFAEKKKSRRLNVILL